MRSDASVEDKDGFDQQTTSVHRTPVSTKAADGRGRSGASSSSSAATTAASSGRSSVRGSGGSSSGGGSRAAVKRERSDDDSDSDSDDSGRGIGGSGGSAAKRWRGGDGDSAAKRRRGGGGGGVGGGGGGGSVIDLTEVDDDDGDGRGGLGEVQLVAVPGGPADDNEVRYLAGSGERDAFFARVDALKLPPNPLDDIIDQLGGPNKVAGNTRTQMHLMHTLSFTARLFFFFSCTLPLEYMLLSRHALYFYLTIHCCFCARRAHGSQGAASAPKEREISPCTSVAEWRVVGRSEHAGEELVHE